FSSPKLSFVSVPALSLNEILAQIMFDRQISEISPIEALQIGQVIIDMSEGKIEDNLFGKLKKNIGIDQFDIKNFGEEEASLKVGKYFNGTLISLEKNIYTEDQQLSVETNLSKEIRLQADISNNAENKMRLKWKHDY
ncbi:MAG: translocation and assembly module TamB, partial [Halioglobus sp.]